MPKRTGRQADKVHCNTIRALQSHAYARAHTFLLARQKSQKPLLCSFISSLPLSSSQPPSLSSSSGHYPPANKTLSPAQFAALSSNGLLFLKRLYWPRRRQRRATTIKISSSSPSSKQWHLRDASTHGQMQRGTPGLSSSGHPALSLQSPEQFVRHFSARPYPFDVLCLRFF